MSEELKPFQRVLVRDFDHNEWHINFFERKYGDYFLCFSGNWKQCIPYNDETAHLLGTTDSPTPPEPEFKWGDKVMAYDEIQDGEDPAIFICQSDDAVLRYKVLYKDLTEPCFVKYCRRFDW